MESKSLSKSNPLLLEILDKKRELQTQLAPISHAIEERIDYILRKIGEVFGFKFDYWFIEGAEEGEVGDIEKIIYRDIIDRSYICLGGNKGNFNSTIIINGEEWNLDYSIPRNWLFKNFEDELINRKKNFELKMEGKKRKKDAQKQLTKNKNQKLIDSAKNKLSKEERKALGL